MKTILRSTIVFITFIILISGPLRAQTIVTDRPDQTESSLTVGKKFLQIESGISMVFENNNQISTRQMLIPGTLFRYGLLDGLEVRLLQQVVTLKYPNQNIQGIGDMELGTKIQICKRESSNSEVALVSHIIFPTGTTGITDNNYGIVNKLSVSHVLTESLGLGYNVGYGYFGNGNGDLIYSIAMSKGVNDKVGLFVEPYGELANLQNLKASVDAGLTYLITGNLQVDISFGTGINHRMNFISSGISWRTGPQNR